MKEFQQQSMQVKGLAVKAFIYLSSLLLFLSP
jgi:hypothetical protein